MPIKEAESNAHAADHAPRATEADWAESDALSTKSMHAGVELTCDICCCEPEPRWIEAMKVVETTGQSNR